MRTRQIAKNTNKLGKLLFEYKFNMIFALCMFVLFLTSPLLFVKDRRSKVSLGTVIDEKCIRKENSYDCNLKYMFYVNHEVYVGVIRKESNLKYVKGDIIKIEYDPLNPKNNSIDTLSTKQTAVKIFTGTLSILIIMYIVMEIITKIPDAGTYYIASTL